MLTWHSYIGQVKSPVKSNSAVYQNGSQTQRNNTKVRKPNGDFTTKRIKTKPTKRLWDTRDNISSLSSFSDNSHRLCNNRRCFRRAIQAPKTTEDSLAMARFASMAFCRQINLNGFPALLPLPRSFNTESFRLSRCHSNDGFPLHLRPRQHLVLHYPLLG